MIVKLFKFTSENIVFQTFLEDFEMQFTFADFCDV